MKILSIPGFENYQISDYGIVFSKPRPCTKGGKILWNLTGYYPRVNLRQGGKTHTFAVHLLVARTWLGPAPEGLPFVLHRDDNPLRNHVSNLYYGTKSQNSVDAYNHGRLQHGEKHWSSKLSEQQVRYAYREWTQGNKTLNQLCEELSVSYNIINCIITKYTWKRVTDNEDLVLGRPSRT